MPSSGSSAYKYPTKTPRPARADFRSPTLEVATPAQEVVGLIQGVTPGSIGEWRVAVALWKYKLEFRYQVPIYGGWGVAGSYIVDFLVYAPFPIPLEVFGEHWHRSELDSKERIKLEKEQQVWGHETVVLWFNDLQTQEAANRAIREAFL